ncbi:MAG: hypothetical protein SPL35_08010 [Bacteroidales bacterium]|nr:hypothetical protein [Bacteroidales bacterium]
MIAKPSIAFNDFAGTAGDVTSRSIHGRTILSHKAYQDKTKSPAQAVSRNALAKISRAYKQLTDSQMRAWENLAGHLKGASLFGEAAAMTGHNAFVRLNSNRVMAGEPILRDAPSYHGTIPNVVYDEAVVTPEFIAINGIKHAPSPYKLVVKMSGTQSVGISNGWSKTVIVSSGMEDDWGQADVTKLYFKAIGVEPVPGQKVFVESYWMDTATGFAGQVLQDVAIVTGESPSGQRVRATMDDLDPNEESHVSSLDVDFSTGAPVAEFNAMCLGHSNVASSEVYLDQQLPAELIGTGICLGRGNGANGKIIPQSYLVYIRNYSGGSEMTFAHRGGYYVMPTECFGSGIIY